MSYPHPLSLFERVFGGRVAQAVLDVLTTPSEAAGGDIPQGLGIYVGGWGRVKDPERILDIALDLGLDWVCVLGPWCFPGRKKTRNYSSTAKDLERVRAFSAAGAAIWAWGWPVPGKEKEFVEALEAHADRINARGLIVNCEAEWLNHPERAKILVDLLLELGARRGWKVGFSSYGAPWWHPTLPWGEFARLDFGQNQAYNGGRRDLGADYPGRSTKAYAVIFEGKPQIPAFRCYPAKRERRLTAESLGEHLYRFPPLSEEVPAIIGWQWRQLSVREDLIAVIADYYGAPPGQA